MIELVILINYQGKQLFTNSIIQVLSDDNLFKNSSR